FLRSESGEITGHHRRGRNETLQVGWILADRRALIAAEEEQFVLKDRAADGAAKLISFQSAVYFLSCGGIHLREVLGCVEQVVSDKFEQVAVKRIRSRLRHRADLAALSGGGVLAADFRFELGQRVWKWKRQGQAVEWINVA